MRVLNLTCFLNYKMKQKKEKKHTDFYRVRQFGTWDTGYMFG